MWEGHLRPVFDVVGPALSLSPASSSFFGEGVVPHDVAKPRQLPSPDGCHERFLGTHETPEQAPHTVTGVVLSVRNAERFPQASGLQCLIWSPMPGFFSRRPSAESMSHIRRAGWRQPVTLGTKTLEAT